jgi:ferric-dicitrate binding protein FerR (iron transport regulator)
LSVADRPESEEERRQERAARFLVRLLDDRSDGLRVELDHWLNEDPHNAVAFARIDAAWDRAAILRTAAPAPDHAPNPPWAGEIPRQGHDQQ